ncbi:MAG TPA: helix-turn-helix transcriptional regulator [Pirellulaceae bacterium]|nr:helix-turn-helix transcriptional regulator [Pirellulaceae bacterium]HMO91006.1 helix-turn-helix transcriptional regulator [Pirellulaceae bacterium]HMP68121.1 helix-turn-helix transcriptional regulator [Pirellulaceae bacterium]
MQYSFRLAELLKHEPDPRKRPGTIKTIVDYTGLDRHQVAALLKNEVKYIPLEALSRLCDYLIEHGIATADQLPGALFAIEPENFWEMLARRRRMEMCLGVRRDMDTEESGVAFVSASDSVIMGQILSGVTTLGGTASHIGKQPVAQTPATDLDHQRSNQKLPQPEHWIQSLVWSPGQVSEDKVIERAHEVYRNFAETRGDKALVCLGSMKSNPVTELVMSNGFICDPFVSQDDVDEPQQRKCPFFIRYRDKDPQPVSCFGGVKLAKSDKRNSPGIYYELANGNWELANKKGDTQLVAFLCYVYRESLGRLEMSLGGFSGKATRELAKLVATQADQFWPASCSEGGTQIGAFIIEFDRSESDSEDEILQATAEQAVSRVIRIAPEAIARRL